MIVLMGKVVEKRNRKEPETKIEINKLLFNILLNIQVAILI